jgi:hypothetical protein
MITEEMNLLVEILKTENNIRELHLIASLNTYSIEHPRII